MLVPYFFGAPIIIRKMEDDLDPTNDSLLEGDDMDHHLDIDPNHLIEEVVVNENGLDSTNHKNEYINHDDDNDDDNNQNPNNANASINRTDQLINDSVNDDAEIENILNQQNENNEDRIRIDPNYRWLLKDLNLTDNKRMMDVTDLIEKNEKLMTNNNNTSDYHDHDDGEVQERHKKQQKQHQPMNGSVHESHDDYDEHNYISQLYEKLVKPDEDEDGEEKGMEEVKTSTEYELEKEKDEYDDDDDDDEDERDRTNDFSNYNRMYSEWSKKHRSQQMNGEKENVNNNTYVSSGGSSSDNNNKKKHQRVPNGTSKFSKSFEVSIEDMDNLIGRVDNGIKLKKNAVNKIDEMPSKVEKNEKSGSNDFLIKKKLCIQWCSVRMIFRKFGRKCEKFGRENPNSVNIPCFNL